MPKTSIPLDAIPSLSILDADGNVDRALLPAIPKEVLLRMYRTMVLSRRLDETLKIKHRAGQMGTFAPAAGQEAAQVGAMSALADSDWLVPSFRELPAALWRGAKVDHVFLYAMGFEEGSEAPAGSRSLPISIPVGSQACHAVGLAWAAKLQGEKALAIVFFGDGATSEGAVHEAMTFAGVLALPAIFLCQNNQWAISTPRQAQCAAKTLAQKAVGYGIAGVQVDGNDVFAVHRVVREAADRARSGGGATLIEVLTWRRMYHTSSDDTTVYRSKEEEAIWDGKDPLRRFRIHLERERLWDAAKETALVAEVTKEIETGFAAAVAYRDSHPDPLEMFDHVFASTPPDLLAQRAECQEAIAGRSVIQGASKERVGPSNTGAVGELEEAADETPAPRPARGGA